MKYNRYFIPITLLVIMGILAVSTIKDYFFVKYINSYLFDENTYFELIGINSQRKNRYIDIKENIISILSWKTSEIKLERGGEYPYFLFKITAPDRDPLFFNISLYQNRDILMITFHNKGNQISYTKRISSKEIFENLLTKLEE
jgi:hypothetical protein